MNIDITLIRSKLTTFTVCPSARRLFWIHNIQCSHLLCTTESYIKFLKNIEKSSNYQTRELKFNKKHSDLIDIPTSIIKNKHGYLELDYVLTRLPFTGCFISGKEVSVKDMFYWY